MHRHFSLQCSQKARNMSGSYHTSSYKASVKSNACAKRGGKAALNNSSNPRPAARHRQLVTIASLVDASGDVNNGTINETSNSSAASDSPVPQFSSAVPKDTNNSSPASSSDKTIAIEPSYETSSHDKIPFTTTPCVKASYADNAADLQAYVKSVFTHPNLPLECKLVTSPGVVSLPSLPTPFEHVYAYTISTPTTIQPTQAEVSKAGRVFQRVAQHQEPTSALQRTPQLSLRRLGNNQSDTAATHFQSTVKYQQKTCVYGRSHWQTKEFSMRFDLTPQPSSPCKSAKLTTSPALQKQPASQRLSDDLATDRSDTQAVQDDTLDFTLEVSEAGDLVSKAVVYVSELLRRVSSRWSSS